MVAITMRNATTKSKRFHSIFIALAFMSVGAAIHSLIIFETPQSETTKTTPAELSASAENIGAESKIASKVNVIEVKVDASTKTLRNEIKALRSELKDSTRHSNLRVVSKTDTDKADDQGKPAVSSMIYSTCDGNVKTIERKYKHTLPCNATQEEIKVDYDIPPNTNNYNLYVVYFLNCKIHDGYGSWIDGQLQHVPDNAFLKIVAASKNCKEETTLYNKYQTLLQNRKNASTLVECHDEADDTFEYHGIRAMWEIGHMHPDKNSIVYYFHSKGLTHAKTFEEYQQVDPRTASFNGEILGQVDKVYEAFDLFPDLNKAGYAMAGNGWVWHNFMFARGSYLKTVEEPIQTTRRYYYEEWLGHAPIPIEGVHPSMVVEKNRALAHCDTSKMDGYNLYEKSPFNVGVYLLPPEGWFRCTNSGQKSSLVNGTNPEH